MRMQNDRLMNTFGDALKQLLQRHQPRIQPVQPSSNLLNSVFHSLSLWNLLQPHILLALHFSHPPTILLLKSLPPHTHVVDSRLSHPDTPPHALRPPQEVIICRTGAYVAPVHCIWKFFSRGVVASERVPVSGSNDVQRKRQSSLAEGDMLAGGGCGVNGTGGVRGRASI
jgi:hypothetical protein